MVFDDERLQPLRARADAKIPAPGWIGAAWKPNGTIMVGINPGGGGDKYESNVQDIRLYGLMRQFRIADTPIDRVKAFAALNLAWIEIQQTHNIWRLVHAIFEATGQDAVQSAFLNVLPFRTREDKPAYVSELHRAWTLATQPQVRALQPRRILALGTKAHTALERAGATKEFEVVLLKRSRGDSRVTPQAADELQRIRLERSS